VDDRQTISGPIASRICAYLFSRGDLSPAGHRHGRTLHFAKRLALELVEAVAHDIAFGLFHKLMTMPMHFSTKRAFGRLISRITSDVDSIE